jgi:hypothetical protein
MEKVKPEKTEQERMQDFFDKYKKLCDEDGFQIVVTPAWKARDDGTFSLIQQISVGRLPK